MDSKERDKIEKTLNFIEELSWMMDSLKSKDIKESISYLKDSYAYKKIYRNELAHNSKLYNIYRIQNDEQNLLIGILPRLLQDKYLFEKNTDLASFAEEVLSVKVTRSEKRSRYEIIGMIVSEVAFMKESKIYDLLNVIIEISDPVIKDKIIDYKFNSKNFEWNNIIRQLINSNV
jgi:hypothetical protein